MGGISTQSINIDVLILILLQLFFVGGVAANYFDEIKGRPWHTTIPELHLWTIGLLGLIASIVIGIYLMLTVTVWFGFFIAIWVFFSITYDLELFKGRFHNDFSLALSGGSVYLGSYFLQSSRITIQIIFLSFIISLIARYGRKLYEGAKPLCKDKKQFPNTQEREAWSSLKIHILFIDIIAIAILVYRILS
jgi:hypothetical protein